MKYQVQELDGRFSYNRLFQYSIRFRPSMNQDQGPLMFDRCVQWCVRTWGWSAEIRLWSEIARWHNIINKPRGTRTVSLQPLIIAAPTDVLDDDVERPEQCNANWSWTNQYDDLRIYLKTSAELAFFQLAHPVDQK